MISLVNFVPTIDEGEPKQEPLNFSFAEGPHYLPAIQKNLFDIFSFSFAGIDCGSFFIDDLEITNDVSTLGRVIVYRIAVDGFATLSAVFILPNGFKDAFAKRKEISDSIASLRNLPSETLVDKENKFSALYDVLEKEHASYVLLDYGVKINQKNKEGIDKVLKERTLTTLVLTHIPKAVHESGTPAIRINEEGDLSHYLKRDMATVSFEAIFALLSSFAFCGSICLMTGGSAGLGIALLAVAIACFVMELVVIDGIYDGVKMYLQNKSSYVKLQIFSAFLVLIFCLLGLLISYVCLKNNIMLPEEGAFGASLLLSMVWTFILVLFAIFLNWPSKIWRKIKKIFRKK